MSQRFTGSNYRNGASFDFPSNGSQTMCAWVLLNSLSGTSAVCYLSTSSGSNNDSLYLQATGTYLAAWSRIGGAGPYYQIVNSPAANTWYHIAVTVQTGSFKTYANGAQVTSTTMADISGRANFVYHHTGFGGDILIQDVMVFGDVLTQEEIRQVMLTNAPVARVAPYAWYKLDNASPLADSSGNSHTLGGGSGSISDGAQIIMGLGPTSTLSTGSAAAAGSSALALTGTTLSSGSAARQLSQAMLATSTTQATGSAQHVTGAALAAASTTRSTGAIAGIGSGYSISKAVDGIGTTNATGVAASTGSAPIVATSTTSTPAFALVGDASIVPRLVGGARSRRSAYALTGRREVRR